MFVRAEVCLCVRFMSDQPASFKEWRQAFGRVAKDNWPNWTWFVLLTSIFLVTEFGTTPFERHISPEAWDDLVYPLDNSTVPSYLVPVYGLLVPLLMVIIYYVWCRCEVREFHDLLFSVFINVAMTASTTNFLKEAVGRPRPNFFERCVGARSS